MEMTMAGLDDLLAEAEAKILENMSRNPAVTDGGPHFDVDAIPETGKEWFRLNGAVSLVVDLRRSTQLGAGKHAASTAAFYEAAIGSLATTLGRFSSNYSQIQGDGAIAVFLGELAPERAICAGITAKTISERFLVPALREKWPDADTGFRVGVGQSTVLVKKVGDDSRVGVREPVWTGKAVNYASKAAHAVDEAHELVVTGSVWDLIKDNDYLTISCGCSASEVSPSELWHDQDIPLLQRGDLDESSGRRLGAVWCATHGDSFCDAILRGERIRPDVAEVRRAVLRSQARDELRGLRERSRLAKAAAR